MTQELRGLAQHAKERGLARGVGGSTRKRTGSAKGPLRKIAEFVGPRSNDKVRVILSCGHEIFVSTATTYRARCWLCARVQRGECLRCSTPLVDGVCPNAWDGVGGLVPPRGKHA